MQGAVAHATGLHQYRVLHLGEPSAEPGLLLIGQHYRPIALAALPPRLGYEWVVDYLRNQLSWEWVNLHEPDGIMLWHTALMYRPK